MTTIQSCRLVNFKNYSDEKFIFHPHVNALVGKNGMGKTNALDAIHLLSFTKSHFLHQDKLLIKHEQPFFRIVAQIRLDEEQKEVVIKYPVKNKKVIELNGASIEKSSDYVGIIPLVFFAPDDEKIVFGGSVERRKLLDRTIAQYDNSYLKNLMTYNKLLNHRNQLLLHGKNPIDREYLSSIDHQMGPIGDRITEIRDDFIKDLKPLTCKYYALISEEQEVIDVVKKRGYLSSHLETDLAESHEFDINLKRTTKGIHKDDLLLSIQKMPFKKFGSQGQIKSLLLALRMAQIDIIKSKTGQEPILIIDDIFDKLDESRINHLIQLIKSFPERQVFVSYTNQAILENLLQSAALDYKLFIINEGKIINEETK